jgi:hypothetical protein
LGVARLHAISGGKTTPVEFARGDPLPSFV